MISSTQTQPTATLWHRVDPRYRTYMRLKQVIVLFIGLIALALAYWRSFIPSPTVAIALLALFLVVFAWFYGVLAHRRYQRTRYSMREWDINLQKGYLFWSQQSMSFNRIQHLVVNQGPLQRLFGLTSLSVYSAGTHGSDIRIPGLRSQDAQNLKETILARINAEPQEPDDAD
ncbi:PH domain-containing protein [Saccharospirillum salsuginis]|nr:PH domain-containing protein [Saccharospirillum salsuginis]